MSEAGKESPEHLEIRGRPQPVRRLNRKTLIFATGGALAIVLLATVWTLRGSHSRSGFSTSEPHNVDHVSRPEGLDALPHDYGNMGRFPKLGPPSGELGRPVVKAERLAGLAPLPERANFRPDAEEDAARAEGLRKEREIEEAAKAPVFFQLMQREANRPKSTSEASSIAHPENDLMAVESRVAPQNDTGREKSDRKQAFLERAADANLYASGTLQIPRSPNELLAGTVIPAALVTGINSDLPGQVIAAVTETVYDTVAGQKPLIPQGSRLLGQYDSQVAFGQRRLLLVWTRLIRPDGSSILLDRLPGVDAAGHAGLEDKVNWHWDRIFAGAAVSTLVGVAAALATPNRSASGNGTVVIATQQSVQDSVNQVGQELTRRNIDIQPTLDIRPGFVLRVIVNKDLILSPYPVETAGRDLS
jgi:type IV secretion system protein VirB10